LHVLYARLVRPNSACSATLDTLVFELNGRPWEWLLPICTLASHDCIDALLDDVLAVPRVCELVRGLANRPLVTLCKVDKSVGYWGCKLQAEIGWVELRELLEIELRLAYNRLHRRESPHNLSRWQGHLVDSHGDDSALPSVAAEIKGLRLCLAEIEIVSAATTLPKQAVA